MNLTDIIPGNQRAHNVQRVGDIAQHKQLIEQEFVGKPRVCAEVAKCIIHIRRNDQREQHVNLLTDMLQKHTQLFVNNSDIRWLVSVCDTIVDTGTPEQRSTAMIISNFVNLLKLWDTSVDIMHNTEFSNQRTAVYKPKPLWAGAITFSIRDGDMVHNMMRRINSCVKTDPLLLAIWRRVMVLLRDSDLTLNRMQWLHSSKNFWIEP